MKLLDFNCKKCGESLLDEIITDDNEERNCPICGEKMTRQWGSIAISTSCRTMPTLPSDYTPRGGANFGRLKDL